MACSNKLELRVELEALASLVLAGIPESDPALPPSGKQQELENKVNEIPDQLGVECRPDEVYRMGRPNSHTHPRLVKLVLPSRSHCIAALSNSYKLRSSCFTNVFIRKSLTPMERKREFD